MREPTSWQPVELSQHDEMNVRKQLALIIGFNGNTGLIEPIGTGILLGTVPAPNILTAAHVLWGFISKVYGPAPRTGLSQAGSDPIDELPRFRRILDEGKIAAVIEANDGSIHVLSLNMVSLGEDRANDIALLESPDKVLFSRLACPMLLDVAPIDRFETYFMAGFAEMTSLALDERELSRAGEMRGKLVIRASRISDITTDAPGARAGLPMWLLPAPSEPGMSGGPLMRLRFPYRNQASIFTAVGATSRGYTDPATREGYTWVSPIIGLWRLPSLVQGLSAGAFDVEAMIVTYQDMESWFRDHEPPTGALTMQVDPREILEGKTRRTAQVLVDAFLEVLRRSSPGGVEIGDLPASKDAIATSIGLMLSITQEPNIRDELERALFALADIQPPERSGALFEEARTYERAFLRNSLTQAGYRFTDS